MDHHQNYFRALISGFSEPFGIASYWAAGLWFMFWMNHSPVTPASPAMAGPDLGRGFWAMTFCVAVCLFTIILGYRSLMADRAADPSLAARSRIALRALLFLIPTIAFTCAFVICALMFFGFTPHQGLGYSKLYTAALFAWHYFLWPLPPLADYLFPIQSVMVHTSTNTEMLAQMCRAAAIVTLIGAVVPTLGTRQASYAR